MAKFDSYKVLHEKIREQRAKVCIVGLGYVGLPLAVEFCKRGYFVYGLDNNVSRIEKLKKGVNYIVDVNEKDIAILIKKGLFSPTVEETVLGDSDIIIICVPTPLRKVKVPDISYVVKASTMIKKYLRRGQFIVLESTSYPTTTSKVVLPILEQSGLHRENDFYLCFSPERVNPGDGNYPLTKIPKVVGGLSRKSTELGKLLYSQIVPAVFSVSRSEVAEMAKLLENTFRLVNIALINEFAIVSHKLGIDIWEVIEAAKTKPFGFMPFYPGPGVGGHCLPCDPVYLSWKAKKLGFKTKMIDLACTMNRFMPSYIGERVEALIAQRSNKTLKDAMVLVIGVTYKRDVKDLRESPALDIIEDLQKKGAKVYFHDPYIPYLKINGINMSNTPLSKSTIKQYDCVVIVTDHTILNYGLIGDQARLIFDTRNVYKGKQNERVVSL